MLYQGRVAATVASQHAPCGAGEVRRATRRARRTLGDVAADIRGRRPRDEHDRFFASAFGAIGDCARRGRRTPHPGRA